MNKKTFSHLDLELYHEKLDNGLNVYIVPKNNVNNKYVTFVTKYGAMHNEFIPKGEDKMIRVPDGVAHFLEHKVFEQEDGIDPFTYYVEHGSDSNASTDSHKTMYLFSGPTNFEENLEYLLDFVQSPYFTDENVESEKGIIVQEVEMYKDSPYRVLYEKSVYNSFIENAIRYPVGGSVESVNSITRDDLYTCYNTFYHPSNMFLVITGDVDPIKTIEIVKQNQLKKNYKNDFNITLKKYNEPDQVLKEKETIYMDVTVPKVSINYKLNIDSIKDVDKRFIMMYIGMFADIKFGTVSLFSDRLKKENIITNDIEYSLVYTDKHILLMLDNETSNPEILVNEINKEINNHNIKEEDFKRKKKIYLSSLIYMSDDIFGINNRIINDIITDNMVRTDIYDQINDMTFEELKSILNKLSFSNYSVVKVMPKK